jgi:transcriptional regulator with XRE-family HTH domain
MTQEQLGFEADLRRTYISILELGQQQPSLETIFKLARALKKPANEIVGMVEVDLC